MISNFEVLSIPTKTNFRGINHREVVIFEGAHGWSEFSPFLEYDSHESVTWLKAALEAANTPRPDFFREKVLVNATLPAVEPERVPEILDLFDGCTTVKIKISDFEKGSQLVAATLDHIPSARIRLDINGTWTLPTAIENLNKYIAKFGGVFEYVEQPVTSIDDLSRLKKSTSMKIAIDESIRKNLAGDLESLRHVADVAIIKWQPSGGFAAAHEIAERIGLPVVVSSALETGIGISHAVALAASFEALPFACGLGTVALLQSDICTPSYLPKKGYLPVIESKPDQELIEKFRASEERRDWWQNRITDVGRLM